MLLRFRWSERPFLEIDLLPMDRQRFMPPLTGGEDKAQEVRRV
ncbi:MAG: hypothetical protein U9Q81_26115 [Pseudomonadota bacterium]|nr:hypothetical protein [Pseudomonadota bacterium]